MKIEKLPSGSYRVRKMIDGKRVSLTFDKKPTQADILKALNQRLNEKVTLANSCDKTFRECAKAYIQDKSNILSGSTKRGYESLIRNIDDRIAELKLGDFDNQVIQQYLNDLTATHSPKTVRNYYGFISAVIKAYIPRFDFDVALPKERKKDPDEDYLPTSEDVSRIMAHSSEKYQICFILAMNGLRRSEVLALTLDDIGEDYVRINKAMVEDENGNWIVQKYNKTYDSNRVVGIDKSFRLRERVLKQGYVYKGHPGKIYDYLIRKQKQLGIHHFKLHALRAYYATELMKAGFVNKDIQKGGGWSTDHVLKKAYERQSYSKDKILRDSTAAAISATIQ